MKKIAVLLLLCLTISSIQGYSQVSPVKDITHLLQQSQTALDKEQYSQALESAKSALSLLPEEGEDSLRMVVNGMMGEVFVELGEVEEGLKYFTKVLDISIVHFGPNHVLTGMAYNNLGFGYYSLSSFKKALKSYEAAIKIYDKVLDPYDERYAVCYGNMAICYDISKDHKKALLFFNKSLQLNTELHGNNDRLVGSDLNNLGMYYQNQGLYYLSINYFKRALDIFKNILGENHKYVGWIYGNIGICYKQQLMYDSAFVFYEKELEVYKKLPGYRKMDVSKTYNNMGSCLMELGQFAKCNEYLKKGLEIRKNKLGDFHPKVASIYENLGISSILENNYDKAIKYFYESANSLNCPSPLECTLESVSSITSLLSICGALGETWKEKCLSSNDENACKLSSRFYERSFQILDKIKTGHDEYESKEFLTNEYFHLFDEYIDLCFRLKRNTSEYDFSKNGFSASEESKSFILKEALQTSDAKKFAGIPDSLLEIEQQLALDITDLEWEKFDLLEESREVKEQEVLALDSKIFDKKKAYHALLADYKSNYPAYFKMKYEIPDITVEKIQQTVLDDQQTLIEYFIGEENHYVFVINRDTFLTRRLAEGEQLKVLVKAYHRLLAGFPQLLLQGDARIDSLTRLGYRLYQHLLDPIKEVCKKELIIIPDGELAYLPFEALLQSNTESTNDFTEMDWLLKDHAISYCNSAALLIELQEESKEREMTSYILTVSPAFGDGVMPLALRSAALGPLTYNLQEAENINELFGGVCLSGKFATADSFKILAPQYRLLHLATHAVANDQAGDFSFLAFAPSKDSTRSSELYAKDIYNLQLDADMVVLSACETGVGELKRGEGMISLARAFTYAGARSLLNSIWQVNDKKTADLMDRFYHYLAKGEQKHIALQKAKLEILKNGTGQSSHPFYWAAFKAYGNMKPVEVKKKSSLVIWAVATIGLLLFLSFRFYKRKKKLIRSI